MANQFDVTVLYPMGHDLTTQRERANTAKRADKLFAETYHNAPEGSIVYMHQNGVQMRRAEKI